MSISHWSQGCICSLQFFRNLYNVWIYNYTNPLTAPWICSKTAFPFIHAYIQSARVSKHQNHSSNFYGMVSTAFPQRDFHRVMTSSECSLWSYSLHGEVSAEWFCPLNDVLKWIPFRELFYPLRGFLGAILSADAFPWKDLRGTVFPIERTPWNGILHGVILKWARKFHFGDRPDNLWHIA